MINIFNYFKRFIASLSLPVIVFYLRFKSFTNMLRSLKQKPKIVWEKAMGSQKILVLALYQRGVLRADIVKLLKEAKAQGIYVIGVNTLTLEDPKEYEHLIDCYIEQHNFGRDFGSYQTGFLHLYAKEWQAKADRVMMANDSVFYTTLGLKKFLKDMMTSEVEVLGSTENFDMVHHMGSFCLSMSSNVLKHNRVIKYWKDYKRSDVRPTVIARGELALSKVLRRVVSSNNEFKALYGGTDFLEAMKNDEGMVDFAIKNGRVSPIFPWLRTSASSILSAVSKRYHVEKSLPNNLDLQINLEESEVLNKYFVTSMDDIIHYLESNTNNKTPIDREFVLKIARSDLLETFMSGSQVHQNSAILLKLGLSFVKLDGLYRGIFNAEDVENICAMLPKTEAVELQSLLMSRPFGGKHYIGWERIAFEKGLI